MKHNSKLDLSRLDLGDRIEQTTGTYTDAVKKSWREYLRSEKEFQMLLDDMILKGRVPSMTPEMSEMYDKRREELRKEGKL